MRRWSIVLGRGGTVLLAVGLALLLVSLIPSSTTSTPETLQIISGDTWQTYFVGTGIMTPEQTLHLLITTNGTIHAYLLETWPSTVYAWIIEHNPQLTEPSNVTYFDEFLDANPASIIWQLAIANETINHEYVPAMIVNVTLAISNHSSDSANVEYQSSVASGVAPTVEVRTLAEFALPLGAVFTIIWLAEWRRAKKGRRP